ncbi:MAG: chemotaxis response regulator protein-glutamate methylesterase [Bdellovibrionota bacterium]
MTPDTKKKTEVLIVDDSKTMRDLLSKILACDEIEVVGTAADALEAEAFMKKRLPDVVTLDIHMPGMDGVTFLRKYLPVHPIPTVMISSINIHESDLVLKALEYGAVDYIQKPTLSEISAMTANMREKIITASKIKVKKKELLQKVTSQRASHSLKSGFDKIVAIGASTGGTEAIKEVLMALPVNIPPIVIVQHIPPVFSTAFARRLNELCPFEVTEGVDGEELRPGKVIIAPGGLQMELIKMGSVYKVKVFDGERVNRHKPSVDVLFNSVAKLLGKDAVGVILTGMGDDGAQGLLRMKNAGAYTIAQDEASSVVYGMPRAAALLGGVQHVSPLDQVAHAIVKTLEKGKAA